MLQCLIELERVDSCSKCSLGERKVMHLAAVMFATPNVWKAVAYKHLLQSLIFIITL